LHSDSFTCEIVGDDGDKAKASHDVDKDDFQEGAGDILGSRSVHDDAIVGGAGGVNGGGATGLMMERRSIGGDGRALVV